jgi:hypothetical protein
MNELNNFVDAAGICADVEHFKLVIAELISDSGEVEKSENNY